MREAKLAARDYEIACKVDESKRQSARDRNLMYREDLKRQVLLCLWLLVAGGLHFFVVLSRY